MGLLERVSIPYAPFGKNSKAAEKEKKKNTADQKKSVSLRFRKKRYLIFAALYILTVLIMGSGMLGRTQTITEGMPSPSTVTAQSRETFESEILTEQRRQEAISGITPVMSVDRGALEENEEQIREKYSALRQLREETAQQTDEENDLFENWKAALEEDPELYYLTELTDEELDYLLQADEAEISMLEDYSVGLIRKYLESGVQEAGIPIARQNMTEEVMTSNLSTPAKSVVASIIQEIELSQTLLYDDEATQLRREEVREAVEPVEVTIEEGEVIVREGQIITPEIHEKLMAADTSLRDRAYIGVAGIALLVLIMYGGLLWFLFRYRPEVPQDENYLYLMALLLIGGVVINEIFAGIAFMSELGSLFFFMVPLAAVAMMAAILLDNELGLILAIILGVFLGVVADVSLEFTLVAVVSSFVGVFSVARVGHRGDLMKSAIYIGLANLATIMGIGLVINLSGNELFWACLFGVVSGLFSSVLAIGILPYFEAFFKITTPLKLLELSDPNQPVLKRLLLEAPGTYHHSIVVSNLAEGAAEAVGADSLLARVGAYYHDIGKIKRPYFFIENQQLLSDNPHDKLSPRLSTLIITSHVKDGVEMARQYRLPKAILEFIRTHHGNSLVSFFHNKAQEVEGKNIKDNEFRYEGPKPVTKEAAIVMLADTVEASVRSIKNPNPGRIEGFIRKVIKEKFEAGQLSESRLTFRELETIARAFVQVLSGIYHQRLEYPDIVAAELERSKKKNGDGNTLSEPAKGDQAAGENGDDTPGDNQPGS